MAIDSKITASVHSHPITANQVSLEREPRVQNEKLLRVKKAAATGDFARALQLVPVDNQEPEFLNCHAVCLIRMHRFEEAIGVLRRVVLSSVSLKVRPELPKHYGFNFATALFFGGHQAGAFDILDELECEEDESVRQLRQFMTEWVKSMSFFARLDWKLNGIASKKPPAIPTISLGRFTWELS